MQKARWGRTTASDCRVSGESLDGCLIFFSFPQEEWISFKENQGIIERLNKEFKRRTKPMGDRGLGADLLQPPGLHLPQDGTAVETEPNGKSNQKPSLIEKIYTKYLTLPQGAFFLVRAPCGHRHQGATQPGSRTFGPNLTDQHL